MTSNFEHCCNFIVEQCSIMLKYVEICNFNVVDNKAVLWYYLSARQPDYRRPLRYEESPSIARQGAG